MDTLPACGVPRGMIRALTAHSGCLGTAPNSFAYLDAALASGVSFVEVDVRLSPARALVLSHDPVGPSSEALSLDSVWERVVGAGVGFNLDVKEKAVLPPLARFLTRRGPPRGSVVITGCDAEWVSAWRTLLPEVPVLYNVLEGPSFESDEEWEQRILEEALLCGAAGLNADYRLVTPGLPSRARDAAVPLDVWTVNHPADLERFAGLGVGITTDRPDLVNSLLRVF